MPITGYPTEAAAVGAVERDLLQVLQLGSYRAQQSGRSTHQADRSCPSSAPTIAVKCNPQTARQAHLYHGIFPVLCKDVVQDAFAEDVDLRVNMAMNVGKALGFFKKADVIIVMTSWCPGSGFTNTVHVLPVL